MTRWLIFLLFCWGGLPGISAQTISRAEAIKIAESFVHHHWLASVQNSFHGKDASGIEVQTPDRNGGRGAPEADCWAVGQPNEGVPYKWGGLDTPASFDAGVRAGKAAGDVYTAEKRRLDGAGVSEAAVGIDCSGFICRCWKLKKRYSTYSLGEICRKLSSPAALEPADIMNQPAGHVLLFVKWMDEAKTRALFYEAAPFSKTLASERDVNELRASGYGAMRYRFIR